MDVAPEQLLLLIRSVDFLNTSFGCKLVGLVMDSELKNVYLPQDSGHSFLFMKDVSREPGVSPDAVAFTDDRFLSKNQSYGVHIAVNDSRSHPSSSMIWYSDPSRWGTWDWALARIIIHEIGHAFSLRDDAPGINLMCGQELESDQSPIGVDEMKPFVEAIKAKGAACE